MQFLLYKIIILMIDLCFRLLRNRAGRFFYKKISFTGLSLRRPFGAGGIIAHYAGR
jgi:hypothetical protein